MRVNGRIRDIIRPRDVRHLSLTAMHAVMACGSAWSVTRLTAILPKT